MSEQIQSQHLNVGQVFEAFYIVPKYQREYVWKRAHVERLLIDIREAQDSVEPGVSEYFIGSLVVHPATGSTVPYTLIDGQQRMTTLFLTLCAIRKRLEAVGETVPDTLNRQIHASYADVTGQEKKSFRLELQYGDSQKFLENLAGTGKKTPTNKALDTSTLSIVNIRRAYNVAYEYFKSEFDQDVAGLKAFWGFLTNQVKLIRIHSVDMAKALNIFETINERGEGLNAMELLKNRLFMTVSPENFINLSEKWKSLQDLIFQMREKPLRFLRYYILSHHDVDAVSSAKAFEWLIQNKNACGYEEKPDEFADKLIEVAENYKCVLDGQGSPYLDNLRHLSGASRQHLILLLAGSELNDDLFVKLTREVEELLFVYIFTHQQANKYEREFSLWANKLRRINSDDRQKFKDFIQENFVQAKKDYAERFAGAFRSCHEDDVLKYRLRYILAKIAQYTDSPEGKNGSVSLITYIESFDIEHIFPQNPNAEAHEEFGEYVDENISGRLGNLTLLEKTINSSIANGPYSSKRDTYKKSNCRLTRALAGDQKVGKKTAINAALEDITHYEEWNEKTVKERQKELYKLACKVWRVPSVHFD